MGPHFEGIRLDANVSKILTEFPCNTVDGRNPAPVDMVNFPSFTGFHTCWVVQDFFHQQ